MFKKEAEEYAEINKPFLNKYDCVCVFKDGAEFGYNKALEEQGDKIEAAYREGVAFGKDKLKDEWHYVKDGDLPKDHILILISNIYGHCETGYYFNGEWFGREVIFNDVYAWCELPLPSEKMKQKWKEIVPPKEE